MNAFAIEEHESRRFDETSKCILMNRRTRELAWLDHSDCDTDLVEVRPEQGNAADEKQQYCADSPLVCMPPQHITHHSGMLATQVFGEECLYFTFFHWRSRVALPCIAFAFPCVTALFRDSVSHTVQMHACTSAIPEACTSDHLRL